MALIAEMEKVVTVRPGRKPHLVDLTFPYDMDLVREVKSILGAKWSKPRKVWTVPLLSFAFVTSTSTRYRMPIELASRIEKLRRAMVQSEELKADKSIRNESFDFLKTYEHQSHGVAWLTDTLSNLNGVLLADDVGLGKTIMSIATMRLVNPSSRVLILAQGSDMPNWERHLVEFAPGFPVTVVTGTAEKRQQLWDTFETGVVIASHDIVARDELPREWDMVIRDEATAFKTPTAQRTKACMKLTATYRLDLTGTPIENTLLELRCLMDWLQPGLLGSEFQFKQHFCNLDFFGHLMKKNPYRNQDELKVRYSPFVLRRTDAVLDLPERLPDFDRFIEMDAKEMAEYQRLGAEIRDWAVDTNADAAAIQGRLMDLRRFVSESDAKWDSFRDLHRELVASGHKIILFTFFRHTAQELAREYNAPLITGGISHIEKDQIIQDFNTSDSNLLVTTGAIMKGKNIQGADVVVHYDALFNPALHRQREGRIRRIGQKRVQRVYNMRVVNTVDDRTYQILHNKQALAFDMLDNPVLSRTDWLDLI